MPGDRRFDEGLRLAQQLEQAGVAAFDVSVEHGEAKKLRMPPIYVGSAADHLIQKVKSDVNIPVIH